MGEVTGQTKHKKIIKKSGKMVKSIDSFRRKVYNIIINQIQGNRNKALIKGEPQMLYDTSGKLSINLKDLSVKYSYSSSNLRDFNGNMIVYEVEKDFETKEQLEDWLLLLVEGHLSGETPISRSLTYTNVLNGLKKMVLSQKKRNQSITKKCGKS